MAESNSERRRKVSPPPPPPPPVAGHHTVPQPVPRTRRIPSAEDISPTIPNDRPRRMMPSARQQQTMADSLAAPQTAKMPALPSHADAAVSEKFEFGEELGRGGMGRVQLAFDRELRRELAVKTLLDIRHPRTLAQFIEEAQITGQLEHPNIVPVHEMGRDADGHPWIAMKCVRGISLREQIRQWETAPAPLSPADVGMILDVFQKICDAVGFAHAKRVIHRDLKPENVMVGEFGEVLVMDWGLAKPLDALDGADDRESDGIGPRGGPNVRTTRRETSAELTLEGAVFGTPAYMAPEQATGQISRVDPRTDIFALGALLYHLLTLAPPYTGKSVLDVVAAARKCAPFPPRQRAPQRRIPRELAAIVMRAMAPSPSRRYQTVADMQADIRAFRELLPVSAYRQSPLERLLKWARRRPTVAMSAAMSVLFVAVLGAVASVLVANAESSARQAAESNRIAAEQARLAAEQREAAQTATQAQREAEWRAMAQQGEIDKLRAALGVKIDTDRNALVVEFTRRWDEARQRGLFGNAFVEDLGPVQVAKYLAAFDEMFAAREANDLPITAADYFLRAFLRSVAAGDYAGSMPDLNRGLELEPNNVRGLAERGLAHFRMGNLADALRDVDASIALDPREGHAWFYRGMILGQRGDHQGAVESYTKVLAIWEFAEGYVNRAIEWRELGRPDRALADIDRAIALNPSYASSHYERGMAHRQMGDFRAAITDFDAAIARDENLARAYNARGQSYYSLNNLSAALADLDRAVVLDPDEWSAWGIRGVVLAQLGRHADARTSFDRARTNCPPEKAAGLDAIRRQSLGE